MRFTDLGSRCFLKKSISIEAGMCPNLGRISLRVGKITFICWLNKFIRNCIIWVISRHIRRCRKKNEGYKMKYMTFNSSCSYAGVANMLDQYSVDTNDRSIAMGMKGTLKPNNRHYIIQGGEILTTN